MRRVLAGALVALTAIGGGAAGHLLRPEVPADPAADETAPAPPAPPPEALDAVTLRAVFVVPVLRGGQVWSHAVLTLGIESATLSSETILAREPRLRDALNHALWTHGSLGGFDGDFTAQPSVGRLRERLDAVAAATLGDATARVLLIAMARQSN